MTLDLEQIGEVGAVAQFELDVPGRRRVVLDRQVLVHAVRDDPIALNGEVPPGRVLGRLQHPDDAGGVVVDVADGQGLHRLAIYQNLPLGKVTRVGVEETDALLPICGVACGVGDEERAPVEGHELAAHGADHVPERVVSQPRRASTCSSCSITSGTVIASRPGSRVVAWGSPVRPFQIGRCFGSWGGPHNAGDVGPNKVTEATSNATARCATPVSFESTPRLEPITAQSCSRSVSPARSTRRSCPAGTEAVTIS